MNRRAAQRNGRGFFEVGVFHPKSSENIGTLWRTAQQLGAAGIFVIGRRYRKQSSDVLKTWRHVPMREHESFEAWLEQRPRDTVLVGVEMDGTPLAEFTHPERAVYLLGAEDHGLPDRVLAKCQQIVSLDAVTTESYNLAVAGSIVMYDRVFGRRPDRIARGRIGGHMKQIWKWSIPIAGAGSFTLLIPENAQFLTCQVQGKTPVLWAAVRTTAKEREYKFHVFETGKHFEHYDDLTYIGTFQLMGGRWVGHLFVQGADKL